MQKPSKAQLKRWSKLGRRKYREKEGLFLAEGERCVTQIMDNGCIDVEALLLRSGEGLEGIDTIGAVCYSVDPDDFNQMADTESPQGLIAVCRIPETTPVRALMESHGIIVATDAIQDPGNFGTMVRTSTWFGATGILSGSGSVDPWNPKVVRSTAGATGVVPIVNGELEDLLDQFESSGWDIFLLDGGEAAIPLSEVTPGERIVVVVGNEAGGIQENLFKPSRFPVRIPTVGNNRPAGQIESLNAATALGIALFSLSR